jgi:hypothetical protein
MKIIDNTVSKTVLFESLALGDVFSFGSNFYMKIPLIEGSETVANAVSLAYGFMDYFNDDALVTKVNCQLVIE